MAIFRKKNKLQLLGLKAVAAKAIHQERDFPTIDLTITVADKDGAKRSDLTEVTFSMTLWEASQVTQQLMYAVSTGQRFSQPRMPINIPWGEGQGTN